MILSCNCKSEFQDKTYGKNKRVKNPAKKAGGYRCTVCGVVDKSTIPTKDEKGKIK